jgi:hypothetical protein
VSAPQPASAPSGVLALPPLAAGSDAVASAGDVGAAAPAGTVAVVEVSNDSWARSFGATEVGDGPQAVAVSGTTIYVGGSFTGVMAGMPQGTYNRVARWDGEAWHRMGEGVDGTVTAITVAGTDVYVGGEFSTAGGQVAADHLARWDGETWSSVGSVQYADQPFSTSVRALACDDMHLYLGGVFDRVGEVAASGLARMELATGRWQPLGKGVTYLGSPGEVHALMVAVGRLWVGGSFDTAGPHTTYSLPPSTREPETGRRTAPVSATVTSPVPWTPSRATPRREPSTSVARSRPQTRSRPPASYASTARRSAPQAGSRGTATPAPRA